MQAPTFIWFALGFSLLILPSIRILKNKKPYPNLDSILYCQKKWLCRQVDGNAVQYDRLQIRVDAGFFMLICLSNENNRKNLVIFYDQITNDERRRIFILSRI